MIAFIIFIFVPVPASEQQVFGQVLVTEKRDQFSVGD
jgi:hypothetical protein